MDTSMAARKKKLRQTICAFRVEMTNKKRRENDHAISETIMGISKWRDARVVCLYMSQPEEVDTKELLADLFNHKKIVVLPRSEKYGLILHKIVSITDLTLGSYGILEPKLRCKIIPLENIDLFIVPGLAFDRHGYRLGWGKGYYDKLLANSTAPKIGLAYDVQVIAEVPHTSYDVPMTMVVTEKEEIICR